MAVLYYWEYDQNCQICELSVKKLLWKENQGWEDSLGMGGGGKEWTLGLGLAVPCGMLPGKIVSLNRGDSTEPDPCGSLLPTPLSALALWSGLLWVKLDPKISRIRKTITLESKSSERWGLDPALLYTTLWPWTKDLTLGASVSSSIKWVQGWYLLSHGWWDTLIYIKQVHWCPMKTKCLCCHGD